MAAFCPTGLTTSPTPSMVATRPVTPQLAWDGPLGHGLEAQVMQAAGPCSDVDAKIFIQNIILGSVKFNITL